jgi:hypothetical protein
LPHFEPAWLPAPFRAFTVSTAKSLGVPLEMVCLQALGVPSLLAGPYIDVKARDGWHDEPATLYLLTIADSGAGKSPAMKAFSGFLKRAERERAEMMKKGHDARLLELAQVIDAGGDGPTIEAAKLELADMRKAGAPSPRLWVTDATDERLATLMQATGGAAAVWSAEPKFFRVAAGAYTKGGGPATDVMLQGYSGDCVRVERQTAKPVIVDRPRLTIAMMTQRKPVEDFLEATGHDERGELARFLMCSPPDLRGWRVPGPSVPAAHAAAADDCARRLGQLAFAPPCTVSLTEQARRRFEQWEAQHQVRQRPRGQWFAPKEWVSKRPGLVLRLAGVIHAAESVVDVGTVAHHLPLEVLERGISIAEWGFTQARDVYRVTQENAVARKLDRLRDVLRGKPGLLRSDLWALLKNTLGITRASHLGELLGELEQCGELRRDTAPPGAKGGRPGERLWLTEGSGEGSRT